MHKKFYASGFLYHPPTQQILLHQPSLSENTWQLFGGENAASEDAVETFMRVIVEHLNVSIPKKHIISVYDYMHPEKESTHFFHYAILEKGYEKDVNKKGEKVSWFTFKQLSKLPISKLTMQDIIVGQRVINLHIRDQEVLTATE